MDQTMLTDIDTGEAVAVKLSAFQLQLAIAHLGTIQKDWAIAIRDALAAALIRQLEITLAEMREWQREARRE